MSSTSHHPRGRKLLVITIDVGKGKQEQLVIHEYDNSQEIAEEFWVKHQYERELKDMLQYQIECTIYEAKSKLLQKESQTANSMTEDLEMEIPLEVTYSEGGIRVSPRNDLSSIPNWTFSNVKEKIDENEPNSELFSNEKKFEDNQEPQQQQEISIEENWINEVPEEYDDFSGNIPESGKKYLERSDSKLKLNINTNSEIKSKTLMGGLAQKYLSAKNRFIPKIGTKTVKLATFKIGTVDPVYNRLATDAKEKEITHKNMEDHNPQTKISKRLHPDYTPVNHGERLYQRSRINKERASRLAKKNYERKIQEDENNAYKPKINEFSHKYYKRSYVNPIEESLKEVRQKTDEDYANARNDKEKEFVHDHPFVPTLTKLSKDIMGTKIQQRNASIHEQLSMVSPSNCRKFDKSLKKAVDSDITAIG